MQCIYCMLVDNINDKNAYGLLTKRWKQNAVWKLLNRSWKFVDILTYILERNAIRWITFKSATWHITDRRLHPNTQICWPPTYSPFFVLALRHYSTLRNVHYRKRRRRRIHLIRQFLRSSLTCSLGLAEFIIIMEKTEAGLERPLYPRNRCRITNTCYTVL